MPKVNLHTKEYYKFRNLVECTEREKEAQRMRVSVNYWNV